MKKLNRKNYYPASHFGPELKKFETIVNNLPREKAFELMDYTVNYFKLKHVKTILPPGASVITAADILCDDIEAWIKKQIYNSAIKKISTWIRLIEILSNKSLEN